MRLFLAAALLVIPSVARGDAKSPPPPTTDRTASAAQMHTDDCARARKQNKTCVLDMGKETLTADKPVGNGVGVAVLQMPKESSLIHIRRDFITEIIKSAEDLP